MDLRLRRFKPSRSCPPCSTRSVPWCRRHRISQRTLFCCRRATQRHYRKLRLRIRRAVQTIKTTCHHQRTHTPGHPNSRFCEWSLVVRMLWDSPNHPRHRYRFQNGWTLQARLFLGCRTRRRYSHVGCQRCLPTKDWLHRKNPIGNRESGKGVHASKIGFALSASPSHFLCR